MQLVGELGDVPGHAHSLIYLAHETDWRSLFILAVNNVATDSVIKRSEMVDEYHLLYSTAALMSVNSIHQKSVDQTTTADAHIRSNGSPLCSRFTLRATYAGLAFDVKL
jgi:hypothetical protein